MDACGRSFLPSTYFRHRHKTWPICHIPSIPPLFPRTNWSGRDMTNWPSPVSMQSLKGEALHWMIHDSLCSSSWLVLSVYSTIRINANTNTISRQKQSWKACQPQRVGYGQEKSNLGKCARHKDRPTVHEMRSDMLF